MKLEKIILITTILLIFLSINTISAADNTNNELNGVNDTYEQLSLKQTDEPAIEQNLENNEISISSDNNDNLLNEPSQKEGWNINFWVSSNDHRVKNTFDITETPISITVNIANSNPEYSPAGMSIVGSLKYPDGKILNLTNSFTKSAQAGFSYGKLPQLGTYEFTVTSEGYTLNGNTCSFTIINSTSQQSDDDYDDLDDEDYLTYASLKPTKLTTNYNSGKTFNVKVVDKYDSSKPIPYVEVEIYVYTGKNYKSYYATTNSNGIAKFKLSTLSVGTHKVEVWLGEENDVVAKGTTSSIKINKATTKISSPAQTVIKGESFKITVKNSNENGVKNLNLKLKVYTGKKTKTYSVKTNSNGVATFKTNKLTVGTHKVVITSPNKNYKVSKTSKIIVKNKKKSTTVKVVNGKYGNKNSFTITIKDGSETIKVKCTYKKSYKQYLGSVKKNGKTYSVSIMYEKNNDMQHGKKGWWTSGTNGGMSDYAKTDGKYNKNHPITYLKLQ